MAKIQFDYPPSSADLNALKRYLHRLTEQLNLALNNISGENMTTEYQNTVSSLLGVSDKAAQLSALLDNNELAKTKSLRDTYNQLYNQIVNTSESITATFNSLIEQTNSEIRTYVEANYISEGDPALEATISSLIQQSADQIRLEFATIAGIDVDMVNYLTLNFSTYIRFSESGIEIGKIGDGASPVVARLTNERLEFVIAGTETVLAYFDGSSGKLHINNTETEVLSIGNTTNGYVDFEMTSDGLFIRWRS